LARPGQTSHRYQQIVHVLSCDICWWETVGLHSLLVQSMLKHGQFRSKIDRNFIFHPLVQGVAAGWASTAYGTNTPDGACWMVGSAGSIGVGCGQEGQGYFHFQPRIFHITPNCRMSSLMVVLQTSLPTVFTPIISSSSVHFSS
jgi:hypothetical protein